MFCTWNDTRGYCVHRALHHTVPALIATGIGEVWPRSRVVEGAKVTCLPARDQLQCFEPMKHLFAKLRTGACSEQMSSCRSAPRDHMNEQVNRWISSSAKEMSYLVPLLDKDLSSHRRSFDPDGTSRDYWCVSSMILGFTM